jgi:hypothetical protein
MTTKITPRHLGLAAVFAGALAFAAAGAAPQPAHAASKTENFLLGLGAGIVGTAIVASAIHHHEKKKWKRRAYRKRVYRYRPRPWTPEWYDYCMAKYRSFNPETGYYRTYSGRYRFCR